jgi:hypothetical protein
VDAEKARPDRHPGALGDVFLQLLRVGSQTGGMTRPRPRQLRAAAAPPSARFGSQPLVLGIPQATLRAFTGLVFVLRVHDISLSGA